MNEIIKKQKSNDLLDLVKLILAFMVVAIHSGLFDPVLYPWLRLAVPLFFIISSYLFFTRINACADSHSKLIALKNFVLRNLKLYAFWFVVLFPINIFLRGWFDLGFWRGVLNIMWSFFLASTFIASWFIMALIIGTVIVFFASKKINNTVLFMVGAVLYLLVSIRSSYMFLFKDAESIRGVLEGVVRYENVMNDPINSFPAGLFWIISGKIFADGKIKVSIKTSGIALGISAALLFTEWFLIYHFSDNYNKDFYIMLAPCALAIFNILIQLKPISLKYAREMRKISVIVYASHGTVIPVLKKLFDMLTFSAPSIVVFLLTAVICVGGAILVMYLEKYKYLNWLKYSH